MARPDKVAVVEEMRDRLQEANATLLTDYRGLSVGDLQELRRELRSAGAQYRIIKNTLARLATREAGVDVPDEVLTGPTAITFCADDPVAAAKVLRAFSKNHPELVIKAGILEGRLLDAEETLKLAELASREELLAQVAGMLGTLVALPARLARANLDRVARVLGALQRKREEAGEAADAPAAAQAGEAEKDSAAQPADEEPAADEPADEEPAAEKPAAGKPAADEPAAEASPNEGTTAEASTEDAGEAATEEGEDKDV